MQINHVRNVGANAVPLRFLTKFEHINDKSLTDSTSAPLFGKPHVVTMGISKNVFIYE